MMRGTQILKRLLLVLALVPSSALAQTVDIQMLPPMEMGSTNLCKGITSASGGNPATTPQMLFYTANPTTGQSAINCFSSSNPSLLIDNGTNILQSAEFIASTAMSVCHSARNANGDYDSNSIYTARIGTFNTNGQPPYPVSGFFQDTFVNEFGQPAARYGIWARTSNHNITGPEEGNPQSYWGQSGMAVNGGPQGTYYNGSAYAPITGGVGGGLPSSGFVGIARGEMTNSFLACNNGGMGAVLSAKYMLDVGKPAATTCGYDATGAQVCGAGQYVKDLAANALKTTIKTDGHLRIGSQLLMAPTDGMGPSGSQIGAAWIGMRGTAEATNGQVPSSYGIMFEAMQDSTGIVKNVVIGNNLPALSRGAGGSVVSINGTTYANDGIVVCQGSQSAPGTNSVPVNGTLINTGNPGGDCNTDTYVLDVSSNTYSTGYVAAGAYFHNSDARLKTGIHPITGALDKLLQVHGVEFNWKNSGKPSMGVVAQNVAEVFPDIVQKAGKDGMMSVQYDTLIGPMIEALRELKSENDAMKAENDAIKARLNGKGSELSGEALREMKATLDELRELRDRESTMNSQLGEIRATLNSMAGKDGRINSKPTNQSVSPSVIHTY